MVDLKLYVEGGGTTKSLHTECRSGFRLFLERAGLSGNMPRIVACGSRYDAFDRFCIAVSQGQNAFLLVDSEAPIHAHRMAGSPENWLPWNHVRQHIGDKWIQPSQAKDTDCHFMVQVMESWFLADKEALAGFFGQGFQVSALPARTDIEAISKNNVYSGLKKASENCNSRTRYKKSEHSFKILARLDPNKVAAASPWAKRFIDALSK